MVCHKMHILDDVSIVRKAQYEYHKIRYKTSVGSVFVQAKCFA